MIIISQDLEKYPLNGSSMEDVRAYAKRLEKCPLIDTFKHKDILINNQCYYAVSKALETAQVRSERSKYKTLLRSTIRAFHISGCINSIESVEEFYMHYSTGKIMEALKNVYGS